jgi:hypothetical protein
MNYPTAWQALVRLIQDGTPVDAQTTNAPIQDLAQRDQYLKDVLDLLTASEALYMRSAVVDASTQVGTPVYLDTVTGVFGPALAAVSFDPQASWGTVAPTSFCWGIVVRKNNATNADICTIGVVRDIDLSAVMDNPTVSGPRYLSGQTAGRLVSQRPAVTSYVLFWYADTQTALVMPTPKELLEGHIHYKYQLYSRPAGEPNNPSYGDKHEVAVPDSNLPGWLPANDPIFGGNAPVGAVFGYNLSQHPELMTNFPPIPADSYYLEVYGEGWGTGREAGMAVRIDNNGIWWMRDDWGWAPWSVDWWEGLSSSSSAVPGTPSVLPPPVDLQFGHGYADNPDLKYTLNIYLWFTRMTAKTNEAMVTSLTPVEGTPLEITDCDGNPATMGALFIKANLAMLIDPELVAGATVLKGIQGTTFRIGKVVEKIRSMSPNIVVNGLETGEYGQETVTIEFINPITNNRELDVNLIGLNNAREESVADVLFLGFLEGRDSSLRARIDVPALAVTGSNQLSLRLRVIGTSVGVMPALAMSYRRIPAGSDTPYDLPVSDTPLPALDLGLVNGGDPIQANGVVEVETAPFGPVLAGDTVFITISRTGTAPADTYGGTVGFVRQKGILIPE